MTGRYIFGIGHRRRRGKDTFASLLRDVLIERCVGPAHEIQIIHFADALKEGIGRHVLGLSDEQLNGRLKTEVDEFWGKTPREMLQRCGTEAMRKGFMDDVWVRAVERKLISQPHTHFIISDVRFPNEAALIRRYDGTLVRVDRHVPVCNEDNHLSETALLRFNGWDFVVKNETMSVSALRQEAARVAASLPR